MYSCGSGGKAEFQQSSLQFWVSHNPSEITLSMLIWCLRFFIIIIIISVENHCAAKYDFFSGFFDE